MTHFPAAAAAFVLSASAACPSQRVAYSPDAGPSQMHPDYPLANAGDGKANSFAHTLDSSVAFMQLDLMAAYSDVRNVFLQVRWGGEVGGGGRACIELRAGAHGVYI